MKHISSYFLYFTKNNRKKGFTLVELLVVIAIIAILSAISMIIFTSVQKSARTAKRVSDLKAISTAVEMYYTVKGEYPRTVSTTFHWHSSECSSYPTGAGEEVISGLVPDYMAKLPADPSTDMLGGSCYLYASNGTDYAILDYNIREFLNDDYQKYPALVDPRRDGGDATPMGYCEVDPPDTPPTSITSWKISSPGYRCK